MAGPLTTDQIAYLKNLANRGEMQAKAILFGILAEDMLGEPWIVTITNPAAKAAANLFAAFAANLSNVATAALTPLAQPDVPRNLRVTFAASWDGGNVTVTGTDQFGAAQSETFNSAPGTVVVGQKIFASVATVAKSAVGATTNTASVGTGDKMACNTQHIQNAFGQCRLQTGAEDAIIFDTTNNAFTPTTVPNGSTTYSVLCYIAPDITTA